MLLKSKSTIFNSTPGSCRLLRLRSSSRNDGLHCIVIILCRWLQPTEYRIKKPKDNFIMQCP